MTVLDVAPQVYYDAATACTNASSGLMSVFQGGFYSLRETSGMAGSVGDGKIWADSYDTQTQDLWKMSLDMVLALDGYAQVLNQAGYNHALADHDPAAGVPEPQLPTLNPAFTGGIDQLIFTLPTSAGGDGRGIIDDGLDLAAKVGIPIPDGDTGKLSRAAELWNAMATHASVAAVATELERAAAMFEQVTSPDASFIDEDLRELKTAASDLAGAYGEMAQSCSDQKTAHDNLRADLEKLLRDMAAEIAKQVVVDLALTVFVTCVSLGVGGAAVAAKTAITVGKIIDKFVDLIKAAIRLAKLKTAVTITRITEKSKAAIQRIKDLTTKLIEKLKRTPKKSLKDELDNAPVHKGRNLPTEGTPNSYMVKKDANGNVTHYTYFDEDGIAKYRVDLVGKAHYDKKTGTYIDTPHVVEVSKTQNPNTGKYYGRTDPDTTRAAQPEEIP